MATALILMGLVILLCFLGIPVGFSLFFVSIAGLWFLNGGLHGGATALSLAGLTTWDVVFSWQNIAIPLFVFMGEMTAASNLGRDAWDFFSVWVSRIRGSLAIVATLASAAFGSITGSTSATIVTIGTISIKEMKRLGYDSSVRTGSIAVAGILANLIPPSVLAIIYCSLTQVSLGKVLLAGLIPGIILTILFALTVFARSYISPHLYPVSDETYSLRQKLSKSALIMPIFIVFGLMIFGIYRGFFSPSEAAGVGCALVFIITLAMRRMRFKPFFNSVQGTVRTTGFIMLLIIGGTFFSNAVAQTRFPFTLADQIAALSIPSEATIFLFIALMILLGCVLDAMALLILFIPLFLPVVSQLGYSPVWFGTLAVVLIEIAAITPPISGNIWIAKGVDPEATVWDVTRGVFQYYPAALILVVLLVFFPEIALWLPNRMMGG